MTSIEVRARVGPDGVLALRVPVGLAEADREVCVTVRTADPAPHDSASWKRFIDETAGAWIGEPLVRPPQGEFEVREPWT